MNKHRQSFSHEEKFAFPRDQKIRLPSRPSGSEEGGGRGEVVGGGWWGVGGGGSRRANGQPQTSARDERPRRTNARDERSRANKRPRRPAGRHDSAAGRSPRPHAHALTGATATSPVIFEVRVISPRKHLPCLLIKASFPREKKTAYASRVSQSTWL